MATNKRYMRKSGDRTDAYKAGDSLRVKWHILYTIVRSTYDPAKDITTIVLEKSPNQLSKA